MCARRRLRAQSRGSDRRPKGAGRSAAPLPRYGPGRRRPCCHRRRRLRPAAAADAGLSTSNRPTASLDPNKVARHLSPPSAVDAANGVDLISIAGCDDELIRLGCDRCSAEPASPLAPLRNRTARAVQFAVVHVSDARELCALWRPTGALVVRADGSVGRSVVPCVAPGMHTRAQRPAVERPIHLEARAEFTGSALASRHRVRALTESQQ
jgi:hypothetical protein